MQKTAIFFKSTPAARRRRNARQVFRVNAADSHEYKH
jgi:hypothetical protein